MKKLKLGVKGIHEVLSREELRRVSGGSGSCAQACGTGGRGHGDACVTTACKPGTCGYYMGIWGCVG